jgi:hypothetical protein
VFVDEYNKCTMDPTCSYAKFAGQQVTWQGRFNEAGRDDDFDYVDIELPPKSLVDHNGRVLQNTIPPQPLHDITLFCDPGQLAQWQNVAPGTTVKFRGRTRGSAPIAYANLGSSVFVLYYLDGCERV